MENIQTNKDIEKETAFSAEEKIRIFQNQTGEKNLRVLSEGGKWVTFYSTRDIQWEMSSFAASLDVPENHIPILLGLGLGYHLREIVKKSSEPVIVVEKDRTIYQLACSEGVIADLLQNPKVVFIVGKEMADAIQEISRKQLQLGLKNFFIIKHPPSIRCNPSFYGPVAEKLQRSQQVKIGSRLKYKKLQSENLRILLINSQYLMMGELSRAIQNLGASLKTLVIEREAEMAHGEFMANLLRILMDFKPDFILTVNHLGFDREGIVTDFLTTLEIPFASWYVDSPMLIIKHYEKNLSPYCAIFLWDEDYIPDMKALGFPSVHYLPLGTDPVFFRPVPFAQNLLASESNEISFVGNSMVNPIKKKMERLNLKSDQKPMIEELGLAYARSSCRNVSEILDRDPYRRYPLVQGMQNGKRVDFEALIMVQGTLYHRLEHIRKLEPFQPVIRGDDGWHTLLNEPYKIGPELLYYYNLNSFYNVSKINFNVTSTQMRNAVNQRVFDVPAAGRLLVTDYKKQLGGLFDVGREMVCYRDKDEIPDLVRFYLSHDRERERIAELGRRRVLSQHTYEHRVREMCEIMRKEFK